LFLCTTDFLRFFFTLAANAGGGVGGGCGCSSAGASPDGTCTVGKDGALDDRFVCKLLEDLEPTSCCRAVAAVCVAAFLMEPEEEEALAIARCVASLRDVPVEGLALWRFRLVDLPGDEGWPLPIFRSSGWLWLAR